MAVASLRAVSSGAPAVAECRIRPVRGLSVVALSQMLLTRRASTGWRIALGGLLLVAVAQHGSAWVAFPTIVTADTNEYCAVMHSLEAGRTPDLSYRNIGYPAFLLLCKQLPMPLNKGLPLVQHVLSMISTVALIVWMRRQWGVLASLATASCLLVNSGRAIWFQYAMPGALTASLAPLGAIALLAWFSRAKREWLAGAALLWLMVAVTREEVFFESLALTAIVFLAHRPSRRACAVWLVVAGGIAGLGWTQRSLINRQSTGVFRYSTHSLAPLTARTLHYDPLAASPRPPRLERLYVAARDSAAAEGWWVGEHLHADGAFAVCQREWGMSRAEAIAYTTACALDCIRQRPGVYAEVVLGDILRFWVHPTWSLEWQAFRQSDPAKFHADAGRLTWARDARAEFPDTYEPSVAQRMFQSLAVLRPAETLAMTPLVVCFTLGAVALLCGVGAGGICLRRWSFVGVAVAVIGMSLFYAAFVDPTARYRMNVEWAFCAVAALGVTLPLRALYGVLLRDRRQARQRPQ